MYIDILIEQEVLVLKKLTHTNINQIHYYEGEDFVTETDVSRVLSSLMTFYICYELKMCESISYAAENVLRSQITSSALDKIKEKEEEIKHEEMKERKEKSILKSVENFKKIM